MARSLVRFVLHFVVYYHGIFSWLLDARSVLRFFARNNMANHFGADILIQAPDPTKAALFYVNHLGFEITDSYVALIPNGASAL